MHSQKDILGPLSFLCHIELLLFLLLVFSVIETSIQLVTMTIILLLFWVQLDHRVNTHDGNASLNSTLELLDLAHAGLQNTSLESIVNPSLHQIQTIVAVGLLLGKGLFLLIGIAVLYTL